MQPAARPPTRSGGTAKTLILVGMILQIVFALLFLFALGVGALLTARVGVGFVLAGVWIVFGILSLIFLFLIYALCYRRTSDAEYEEAKTPTLIFGILSLIFAGVISGILYIIAYIKLEDAVSEQRPRAVPAGYGYGVSPSPPPPPAGATGGYPSAPPGVMAQPLAGAFCSNCGRPLASDQRFCPGCGRPRA